MTKRFLLELLNPQNGEPLPATSAAWRRVPELLLASMSLVQLRQLAQGLRLRGYAGMGRERLNNKLLKRLKRRR